MAMRMVRMFVVILSIGMAAACFARTFVTIDFPGAISTDASGINSAGQVVGTYVDAANATHGFGLDNGVFTTIDYPRANSTSALSINERGEVAGFFLDAANQWHGFVLSRGVFSVQDYPDATTGSFTLGISANGTLVGEYKIGETFGQLGHAWIMRHGDYTQLIPPGSTFAFATSVNSRGDVVGRLIDGSGAQTAWKLDKDGTYHVFQFPGATITNARSINTRGEVVGVYRVGVNHGFALTPEDFSNFTTIDFPGAVATRALGINPCGDIVGSYGSTPAGTGHGFLLLPDDARCDE